jgi:nucleotide-binding universal stress UspA family protein
MAAPATPHRLLVAVDTNGSSEALDFACRLARRLDGTVTLLAVAPMAVRPAAAPGLGTEPVTLGEPEEQQMIDRLAREHLDEVATRVGDGLDVRTALSWGPAGQAIVDELDGGEYDLAVVAARREGALGHLIHDHAVRHVLYHSPVPVLVVPELTR